VADDATNSPPLTVLDMESLRTASDADAQAATRLRIRAGVAATATETSCTADRSSPLSAADEQRLYRIRKDRTNRFMVSVTDVDFLLEMLERLGQ
jgi:hypothetical protein